MKWLAIAVMLAACAKHEVEQKARRSVAGGGSAARPRGLSTVRRQGVRVYGAGWRKECALARPLPEALDLALQTAASGDENPTRSCARSVRARDRQTMCRGAGEAAGPRLPLAELRAGITFALATRMLRAAVVVSIFAACTSSETSEVFDGAPQRFVVDSVTVPTVAGQAAAFGYDFDGDGEPDNAFGNLTTTLASEGDIASDVADLVSDGVLTLTIEIVQGDQGDDVQITWDSLATWTASVTNTGAITTDGPMPVSIVPRVPALIDADPTQIPLDEVAMQLIPDDAGGYSVQVQALADGSPFRDAAATSVVQMIASNPSAHRLLEGELGNMSDDVATVDGVEQAQLFQLLTTSDQANGSVLGRLSLSRRTLRGRLV